MIQDLVYRAMNGDSESYEELYRLHLPKVIRTAFLLTKNYQLAEDVAQEVFIKIFQSVHTLKSPERFSSWLYRIVVNTVSSKMRKIGQTEKLIDDLPDIANVEEIVVREETREIIREAIQSLPDSLKILVILKCFNELTDKEMAYVMSCPIGTVKSRLHQAKKYLNKYLYTYQVGMKHAEN